MRVRLMFHLVRMLTDAAYVRASEWHEQVTSAESNPKHIALQTLGVVFIKLVPELFSFLVKIARRFDYRVMQSLVRGFPCHPKDA